MAETAEHHVAQVRCSSSGESYDVAIPGTAKHHWITWGDKDRVWWNCKKRGKRCGVEHSRGTKGITVVDEDGEVVRLKHGDYHVRPHGSLGDDLLRLTKAKAPMKPGSRWITVHPWGEDGRGVPVLIEPRGDGKSWRIVGGAGGKLNHLILNDVDEDTPENREKWKENAKDRKGRREKKKKEIAERDKDKPARKQAQQDLQHAKTMQRIAERRIIASVREHVGGVDEDLPEEGLSKLTSSGRAKAEYNHHQRQLRQAKERLEAIREQVTQDEVIESDARAAVRKASLEADPAIAEDARALAQMGLDLEAEERKERRADRARKASRHTKVKSGELAAEQMADTIRAEGEDKAGELEKLGGRAPPGEPGKAPTAVDDLKREVAQHREDAWLLTKLADGEELTEQELGTLMGAARAEGWALDPEDLDELARGELDDDEDDKQRIVQTARNEAARKWRRAELREDRVPALEAIEAEKGDAAARGALAYARMQTRIAAEVRSAREAGLEAGQPEIQQAEIREVMELLADAEKLREARQSVKQIQRALDEGKYGKARDAFTLKRSDEAITDDVKAKILDDVRTQLTQQLTGLADTREPEHLKAAAAGQFDSLSDVALGIGQQRYLDREVVDGIGLNNAAILQRFAMEQAGHEPDVVLKALEKHHVDRMEKITADAIAQAAEIVPDLVEQVRDVHDIEKALTQVDVADADLAEAQRAIGAALGRMEATAALGQAFRDQLPDSILIPHEGDKDGTLRWAQAMGLKRGLYSWDDDEKGLRVPKEAWGALIRPHDADVDVRAAVDAIKKGEQDDPDWLPAGIVAHAKDWFNKPPPIGDRPRLYEDLVLTQGGEALTGRALEAAVDTHVLSRLAEGEDLWTIRSELLAPGRLAQHPDVAAFVAAIDKALPVMGKDELGRAKPKQPQQVERLLERKMEAWAKSTGKDAGIYGQNVDFSQKKAREAVFYTASEHPWAAAAYKPRGELTHEDRRSLRAYWEQHVRIVPDAKKGADTPEKVRELAEDMSAAVELGDATERQAAFVEQALALGDEPPKEPPPQLLGMFDAVRPDLKTTTNPEWDRWQKQYKALQEEFEDILGVQKPGTWEGFVWAHRGAQRAYLSLQHAARGTVNEDLVANLQRAGIDLRTSTVDVPHKEYFQMGAGTSEVQQELRKKSKSVQGRVQKRGPLPSGGEGWVDDDNVQRKMVDSKVQEDIGKKQQGSMFDMAAAPAAPGGGEVAPDAHAQLMTSGAKGAQDDDLGRRSYVGPRLERALAEVFSQPNLPANQSEPADLFPGLSMSGSRIDQQRTVKTLFANGGRLGGWLGTGSGKSLISIGSATEAIERGETKKGLFLAPTSVVEQFAGEMMRFTEPGKYRWATGTGMSHEQRVAALKSDDHFLVLTHQSFRDTALRVMADHHRGGDLATMRADLDGVDRETRARWMREAFDATGIPRAFIYYDEAHMGAVGSGMGLVKSMVTHPTNATHMLLGTATPHKNDESEMAEMAALIRPDRYGDKEAFLRNFGENARYNADSVRREMAPYTFSAKIDPSGVDKITSGPPSIVDGKKVSSDEPISLHPTQQARVAEVRQAYAKARAARDAGQVDLESLKTIHPDRFEGKTPEEQRQIGKRMGMSLGFARDQALRRAINQAPVGQNAKLDRLLDVVEHDVRHGEWRHKDGTMRKGKPTIIFTNSKREARMIHDALVARGLRSVRFDGDLPARGRQKARLDMKNGALDVMVCTEAAEAGVNVQRAKVVHHFDVPPTEKAHAQRSGRAYRQGQKGDVEIHDHYTADEYETQARRRLRRKRGLAGVFETPIRNMDEVGVAAAYQHALAEKHADKAPLAA